MVSPARIDAIDGQIWALEASYLLPEGEDRVQLLSLLRANEHAVAVLKEASNWLKSIFGSDSKLLLQLDRDPESGFEEIFATVRSPHTAEVGLELMADFDQRWWLTRLPYVQGRLNFIWEPLR